jgi:hypothetical protein
MVKEGDQMEWVLFGVILAVAFLWLRNKSTKVATSDSGGGRRTASRPTPSGRLAFQDSNTAPKTDADGRVIVKLKGGAGITFGVNKTHMTPDVELKLAGKVNDDEEFAKSVKARVRPDTESQYENSFIIETLDGKLIGWILKDDSSEAGSVFGQIDSALRKIAPEVSDSNFVFEVSLRIEGYWNEISEEGDLEEWEPDFDLMEIRIKLPVEMEVD